MQLKKLIGLSIVVCLAAPLVQAESAPVAAKKTAKKHPTKAKGTKAAKAESKAGKLLDDDNKEFNAGTAAVTNVTCELGSKVTLYRNAADTDHMALRWNQRVHQMTRVSTSTGADRFENAKYGLVWIGIPAKGMLLDAKRGQQLANECKDAEQMHPVVAAPDETARPAEPPAAAPVPALVSAPGITPTPVLVPEPKTETTADPKVDSKK